LVVYTPLLARREAKPNGVVETLSAGYAAINRQLWVLLIPIVVDLFLWLGPHVSYSPLLDPALARGTAWMEGSQPGGDLGQLRQALMTLSADTNTLALLARGPLALPSVALAVGGGAGALLFVYSWTQGLALFLGSLLGGLVLGGFFYAGIAQQVRGGGAAGPLAASRGVPGGVLRVLGLVGLLVGLGVLLGVPLLALVALAALVVPAAAAFVLSLVLLGVALAGIYLFFAVDAIFVSGVGPLDAIRRSAAVVRRHPWPSLGLVLLTWLILTGMDQVWQLVATSLQAPFGVALSVLGNAYIASGLLAASMIFYQERSGANG
jgi:hypothetical protein